MVPWRPFASFASSVFIRVHPFCGYREERKAERQRQYRLGRAKDGDPLIPRAHILDGMSLQFPDLSVPDPGRDSKQVKVKDSYNSKACAFDLSHQFPSSVAAIVLIDCVDRTVQRLKGGNLKNQSAAGLQHAMEA